MNVKKIMLSFGIVGGVMLATTNCLAADISITKIEKIRSTADRIVGSFELKNNENIYYPNLFYVADLCKTTDVGNGITFTEDFFEYPLGKIELKAGETKTIYFDYEYPEYLDKGIYQLKIELLSKTEHLQKEKYLKLGQIGDDEGFLVNKNYAHWLIDGEQIGAYTGPNVDMNERPVGVMEVKSTFKETKTITPQITIYNRLKSYDETPVKIVNGDKFTIKSGETKKVNVKFPGMSIPESYLAKVVFLDDEGNQVSNEYEFRYVVRGASAKILDINAEYISEDNTIEVEIEVIGSADDSELENCKVIYNVYNEENNRLIKSQELMTNLGSEVKYLDETIGLNNNLNDIRIEAKILYNNIELANAKTSLEIKNIVNEEETVLFNDILGTKYYEAVKVLNGFKIFEGYPDGTFKAEKPITRAEFTVIATKLAKLELKDTGISKFNDVATTHWAKDFINLAYENNIINGYGNGIFKPDNKVSYQEALTILINVMGLKEEVAQNGLTWPDNYIAKSNELNLMNNIRMFNLANSAIRGDVALMTYETYLKLK